MGAGPLGRGRLCPSEVQQLLLQGWSSGTPAVCPPLSWELGTGSGEEPRRGREHACGGPGMAGGVAESQARLSWAGAERGPLPRRGGVGVGGRGMEGGRGERRVSRSPVSGPPLPGSPGAMPLWGGVTERTQRGAPRLLQGRPGPSCASLVLFCCCSWPARPPELSTYPPPAAPHPVMSRTCPFSPRGPWGVRLGTPWWPSLWPGCVFSQVPHAGLVL